MVGKREIHHKKTELKWGAYRAKRSGEGREKEKEGETEKQRDAEKGKRERSGHPRLSSPESRVCHSQKHILPSSRTYWVVAEQVIQQTERRFKISKYHIFL